MGTKRRFISTADGIQVVESSEPNEGTAVKEDESVTTANHVSSKSTTETIGPTELLLVGAGVLATMFGARELFRRDDVESKPMVKCSHEPDRKCICKKCGKESHRLKRKKGRPCAACGGVYWNCKKCDGQRTYEFIDVCTRCGAEWNIADMGEGNGYVMVRRTYK